MSRRCRRSTRRTTVVTLVAALSLAACGGDDASTDTASAPADTDAVADRCDDSAFPVTVTGATGDVTLDAQPTRIVVLSPTHTEMLFAIDAGSQVVAVDDRSDYPAAALVKSTSLSGFTPNVEAIAGYEPDLVVIADDFTGLADQLAPLDIPVWSGATAASFDDVYAQIEQLGSLTGCEAGAEETVAAMRGRIDEAVAAIEPAEEPLSYYYELDDSYFSATSNTFVGQVLALYGLENIADEVGEGNDYPQLSAEAIIEADPDLIFLADTDCCGQSLETVAARPGWDGITAVREGQVIALDDDIASRWGPRLVDLIDAVGEAVSGASAAR